MPRQRRGERVIVRMYDVASSYSELFFLRLLLLPCRGATSFKDVRNVQEIVHKTLKEACKARQLLANDAEYMCCLQDTANVKPPASFRRQILAYCALANPKALYCQFFKEMVADYQGYNCHHTKQNRVGGVEAKVKGNGRVYEQRELKLGEFGGSRKEPHRDSRSWTRHYQIQL